MCIRLISAPEASRCPLEAVSTCVPARVIDFSGQALHPHILALGSAMLCCSCLAASSWCFPRVYGSFTFEPKVNVPCSAAPAVSWHAESLCFHGLLYPFKCLVLGWNVFTVAVSRAGRLRNCLKLISFPCLFLACPFSFMSTRFSRSAGRQQMFAEMDFRSCLYCHYSAFV